MFFLSFQHLSGAFRFHPNKCNPRANVRGSANMSGMINFFNLC